MPNTIRIYKRKKPSKTRTLGVSTASLFLSLNREERFAVIYVAGKAFIESDISIESARFIGEAVVIHPDPYRDISLAWYGQVVTTRRLGTNSVEVVLSNGMVFTVDSRKARVLVPDQTGASSNVLNLDPFRQKQTDN